MHTHLQTSRLRQYPTNPGKEGLCGHEIDRVYRESYLHAYLIKLIIHA